MTLLYITADRIGAPTGGGSVTANELKALRELGHVEVFSLADGLPRTPFEQDQEMLRRIKQAREVTHLLPRLAHCYAGCLSNTVAYLQQLGCKVTYTAAAHDVGASREEHLELGLPFDYPHLNVPSLWMEYLEGYKRADVLIVPSLHSQKVMEAYGCAQRVEVVPHGVNLPDIVSQPSKGVFVLGYLGAVGPDKGLRYLLRAWDYLDYRSGERLLFAGAHSTSEFMKDMVRRFAPKSFNSIGLQGWIENVSDFYNSISCLAQPSISEGFGCEVLEAAAHGRPVICSRGAGASYLMPVEWTYEPADLTNLISLIIDKRATYDRVDVTARWRRIAEPYAWPKIHEQYQKVWRSLL